VQQPPRQVRGRPSVAVRVALQKKVQTSPPPSPAEWLAHVLIWLYARAHRALGSASRRISPLLLCSWAFQLIFVVCASTSGSSGQRQGWPLKPCSCCEHLSTLCRSSPLHAMLVLGALATIILAVLVLGSAACSRRGGWQLANARNIFFPPSPRIFSLVQERCPVFFALSSIRS